MDASVRAMKSRRKDEGGIMLEAALIFPVILLLVSFMLAQIRSVRYETLVGYALDQTAEEIAILIPLGDQLLKGVGAADIFSALPRLAAGRGGRRPDPEHGGRCRLVYRVRTLRSQPTRLLAR